jgi:hypothetical protein
MDGAGRNVYDDDYALAIVMQNDGEGVGCSPVTIPSRLAVGQSNYSQ